MPRTRTVGCEKPYPYVVTGTSPAWSSDASGNTTDVVRADKSLINVERDFRSLKTIDLDLRPISHDTEGRMRPHVLVCMLAAYLTWHLRAALAPLTFTDEAPPERPDPVAPARRSVAAGHQGRHHQLK